MSSDSDSRFKHIKKVLKSFGHPSINNIVGDIKGVMNTFLCQYTNLPTKDGFSLPGLKLKLDISKAEKEANLKDRLKKEQKKKKEADEAVDAPDDTKVDKMKVDYEKYTEKAKKNKVEKIKSFEEYVKDKKAKAKAKDSKDNSNQLFGCFLDPPTAVKALHYACTKNNSWLQMSEKSEVLPLDSSITINEVAEYVAVALANLCENPKRAVVAIRPLLLYANQIPDRDRYHWFLDSKGGVSYVDALSYRASKEFLASYKEFYDLFPKKELVYTSSSKLFAIKEEQKAEQAKKRKAKSKKSGKDSDGEPEVKKVKKIEADSLDQH